MTTKDLPGSGPNVACGYDNIGRLTSAVSSTASLGFTYDQLNRLTRQTSPQMRQTVSSKVGWPQ